MFKLNQIIILVFFALIPMFLASCNGKLPGGDARKFPANPEERVKQNLEQGRGFKLNDSFGNQKRGVFEFASSNSLWRASLDVIDFMPLSSVNYSGGIIITDWYSENSNSNESVKISIRFMTNEIRSDSLKIKVFNKKCIDNLLSCKITEQNGILVKELKREILKKATLYKEEDKKKKK
ncbi:DUF3576 domain-containing protein [Candidatus Pelagibacter sp.]|nr:DUF3576 domain-containing protein [Candidatus Pelagibacter sp.]